MACEENLVDLKHADDIDFVFEEVKKAQLNVLHLAASYFSRYEIPDIAIHVYLIKVLHDAPQNGRRRLWAIDGFPSLYLYE
ncbi:hypothetical protein T265_15637, partial [Opisthorchis viverrini]